MSSTEIANPFPYNPKFKNSSEIVMSCLSFLYSAPAFYIVFRLGILFTQGRLKCSFQKLVCVFGVNDLLCYVLQMLTLRLPYWGIVPVYEHFMNGFVPTFLYFGFFACCYIQVCGCVFLALNRASSIFLPFNYERLWRVYGWSMILIMIICIQYLPHRILVVGARFFKAGPAVYIIGSTEGDFIDYGYQGSCALLVSCIICFVLNMYTGCSLYKLKRMNDPSICLKDVKFFYICLCVLLTQGLVTVKHWAAHYATPMGSLQRFCFAVGPTLYDINCLFPLYSVIMLSQEIRCKVFPFLLVKIHPAQMNTAFHQEISRRRNEGEPQPNLEKSVRTVTRY